MKNKNMKNKPVKFSINYNTINNISLYAEYEKKYRILDFSHKYKDYDTNERITYDDLIKLMNNLKKENIINGYSGEGTEFRSSYILYYNPCVIIKYNNCCEMIKYFIKYEDALEYYNEINKKINFLDLY
jgi:hypothetical protein